MTPRDLQGVLDWCAKKAIPVGVDIDVAINAHKQAADELTLRTVVLARTAQEPDLLRQHDYLAALPIDAWPAMGSHTAAEIRADTLAGIARALTWRRACG